MKYFSIILILLIFCFASCDGRDRIHKTNTENFEGSKMTNAFFELNTYIPQHYTQTVTDTILSSNLRVNIKYYSLFIQEVLLENTNSKNQIIKEHYRQFESQISVFKKDKILFTNVIKASDFHETDNLTFWDNAILQFVWLDDFNSSEEKIAIYCSFLEPKSKAYKSYKVYFNASGERNIELLESS